MNKNTIKGGLAYRVCALGLMFFLLSFVVFDVARPAGFIFALVAASAFFSFFIFVSVYIASAQELWLFRRLAEGGRKGGDDWVDLPEGEKFPDEVEEMRGVLNTLKRKMDEAVLSQKRFLADASHEMRSPITIMKGDMEIALRRERDPDEYRRVLVSNLEEIDRLEYLLKDLMFLARTDASELVMNFAPVSLDEVLVGVYEGLRPLSVRKGITMGLKLREDEGCVIEGDADRLKQLFVNLVENALRYTPEGGHVEIELKKIAGVTQVIVSDTGIGIPEKDLGKIFERFYRVDKARARESGGSGLGLCICKWIVENHKGEILIESTEGAGTKVTCMFL